VVISCPSGRHTYESPRANGRVGCPCTWLAKRGPGDLRAAAYRARKNGATKLVPFTPAQWQEVLDFYIGRCAYCRKAQATDMEHVVPLADGGHHALYNLVPSCAPCNRRKGAHTWEPQEWHHARSNT